MAELHVEGDELVLHLSGFEKVESVHGDLRVPLSAVQRVEVLDNAHQPADIVGLKVGARLYGVFEVATIHGLGKTIFAVVHHDTPRGVRVILEGTAHDEWIVGCADPEAIIASVKGA